MGIGGCLRGGCDGGVGGCLKAGERAWGLGGFKGHGDGTGGLLQGRQG